MNREIFEKITEKKEFSQLPEKDVEMSFKIFEKRQEGDEEKIRLTRDLLRKVFSGFSSSKLFSLKNKSPEWILRKHLSTRERFSYYVEVYRRILRGFNKQVNIIDLGAGVNGFSYDFFKKAGFSISYLGVEAVGQLVDLMNSYFEKIQGNARAEHLSLFDLEKIEDILKKTKKPRVVLMFKIIDSLEMLKRDYSKELLIQVSKLSERIILSFATESMIKRKSFKVNRKWILDFCKENFKIKDDFEIAGERYIVLEKR
jgi:hypothetical protein